MRPLQRLVVDRAAELGYSYRKVAKRAQDAGMSLSPNTVSNIGRGDPATPKESTVAALAYALKLPVEQVREAADLPVDRGLYEPPECSRYLTVDQRKAVSTIITQLAMRVGTGE